MDVGARGVEIADNEPLRISSGIPSERALFPKVNAIVSEIDKGFAGHFFA